VKELNTGLGKINRKNKYLINIYVYVNLCVTKNLKAN